MNEKINMKDFVANLEEAVEDNADEITAWIATETESIVSWRLLQTAEERTGKPLSFIIFTTTSGQEVTLPLNNENVSSLIYTIVTNTPNIDPESVPYIPTKTNFWKKYKFQIILLACITAFLAILTLINVFAG